MSRREDSAARPLLVWALAAWLLGGTGQSLGQEAAGVYRCGDGRYSQTPCPGGTRLTGGAAPTPEQQREAQQAAERERRLADQLRAERHAREKAATPGSPARIGPPPVAASKPGKSASKPHEPRKKRKKQHEGSNDGPDSRRAYAPKPKD